MQDTIKFSEDEKDIIIVILNSMADPDFADAFNDIIFDNYSYVGVNLEEITANKLELIDSILLKLGNTDE